MHTQRSIGGVAKQSTSTIVLYRSFRGTKLPFSCNASTRFLVRAVVRATRSTYKRSQQPAPGTKLRACRMLISRNLIKPILKASLVTDNISTPEISHYPVNMTAQYRYTGM